MTPTTLQEARERLMNYCSRYETCYSKALQKLKLWQIEPQHHHEILQELIEHKFIDDERYAQNYVRSKASAKWGIQKIRAHLQMQKIAPEIISDALNEIDMDTQKSVLEQLLRKKIQYTKAKTASDLYTKLLRFAMGRGYSYQIAVDTLNSILNNEDN
jgi:regulatory protein